MAKFVIEGGKPIRGEISIKGSKNASLPLIAASILVPETNLSNVPRIRDVDIMLEIISYLGGHYEWNGSDLYIETKNLKSLPLPDSGRKLRASILFAGPLLARFGYAELPYPGGDIIGVRPLDAHFRAFDHLGVQVERNDHLIFKVKNPKGVAFNLEETSVTATENILMYAAGIGESV